MSYPEIKQVWFMMVIYNRYVAILIFLVLLLWTFMTVNMLHTFVLYFFFSNHDYTTNFNEKINIPL